jgi:dienelactone hydrolase
MVWIGCGADQNPIPRREVELAIEYGKALGQAVKAAADQRLIPLGGKLEAAYEEVPLEFAAIPSREAVEAMAKSDNKFEAGRGRMLLARWDRDGGLSKTYPYPVQSWRLGDGPTWIFLGGEVVVDFGLRLKLELGAGKTWVAGYCNDVMAYIASRRVLKEGGYEGATAMTYYGQPSPWAESSEDAIISAARGQAAKLGDVPADEPRSIAPVKYPDHTDLTQFIDESGKGEKVETSADWQRRREHILESMQWVMGRLPKEKELEPLKVVERGRESFEKYDRLLITYHVAAGQDVTAHLYVPKGAAGGAKRSAVLALHPTSAIGKLVVAGDGPKANRNYAVELADRGYVVLAPDYPSFGELTDYPFHTDAYLSGTMTAIVNHRRGVDLLIARDDVDPERIAVIGHSLGGHNSMFVGVFDERIKAVVSSCGWDPFHYYYGGKLAGWASDRYMPRIREMHGHDPGQMAFDFPEVAAAIAPRAFFSCSPLRDSNFDYRGVKECEPNVRQVYRLLGAEENFVIRYPDSDHDFPPEVRQEAYEFLDRVLAGSKAPAAGK